MVIFIVAALEWRRRVATVLEQSAMSAKRTAAQFASRIFASDEMGGASRFEEAMALCQI
jgi:hypothetical protein